MAQVVVSCRIVGFVARPWATGSITLQLAPASPCLESPVARLGLSRSNLLKLRAWPALAGRQLNAPLNPRGQLGEAHEDAGRRKLILNDVPGFERGNYRAGRGSGADLVRQTGLRACFRWMGTIAYLLGTVTHS